MLKYNKDTIPEKYSHSHEADEKEQPLEEEKNGRVKGWMCCRNERLWNDDLGTGLDTMAFHRDFMDPRHI